MNKTIKLYGVEPESGAKAEAETIGSYLNIPGCRGERLGLGWWQGTW